MYAIVATGGKQYKVEVGDVFVVERIDGEPGTKVDLPVLLTAEDKKVTVGPKDLAGVVVSAEIVEHTRGAKVIIFKFKKRKGYKRTRGHRQELTVLRVLGIGGKAASKPAAKAAEKPATETAAEKPAAAKPAAAKRPAAPKPATKAEAPAAVALVEEKPKRTRAAAKPKTEAAAPADTAEKPAPRRRTAKPKAEDTPAESAE